MFYVIVLGIVLAALCGLVRFFGGVLLFRLFLSPPGDFFRRLALVLPRLCLILGLVLCGGVLIGVAIAVLTCA